MAHYSNQDQFEREPLDPAYDHGLDTPPRRPAAYDGNQYSQAPSPYYDDSPQRRPEPYTPHYEQSRYDNFPDVQDGPPPPPPHGAIGLHSRTASASQSRHDNSYRGHSDAPSRSESPYNMADRSARDASGMDSLRSTGQVLPPPSRAQYAGSARNNPSPRHSVHSGPYAGGYPIDGDSRSSVNPFGTVASSSVGSRSPSRSPHVSADPYAPSEEGYYSNYATNARRDAPHSLGMVDPMSIEDDGDDGLHYGRQSHRNSGNSSSRRPAAAAAAVGAAAGGSTAVMGEHGM